MKGNGTEVKVVKKSQKNKKILDSLLKICYNKCIRKQKHIFKKEGIYYGYDLRRSSGTGNRYLWW